MQDWLKHTASDLGRGIAAGQIDPVALTETYLEAINAHPFAARIYARVTPERARAEAKAASERARLGLRRSLLDGVPISWKDLFDSAGTATEAGSRLLAGRVPQDDALVLANATAAGLVCLGKTHMTELAFSGLGLNPMTQSPPCVNDHEAVSGGSSSGAATSTAFGLAAAGIGSDTGGSVRIPAAWNDLVGFKTSPGWLSLKGVVPLCAGFDTVGPLCRSVEDAAHLTAVMQGTPAPDLRGATLEGARFMALNTVAMEDIRDQPRAGFLSARERLQAAGAVVETHDLACVAEAIGLSAMLFAPEAYATWRHRIEAEPDLMFPPVRERFRAGATVLAADYIAAWQRLAVLRRDYLAATAGFDGVLIPSSPILPPNKAKLESDPAFFAAENLMALRNTRIGNLMGLAGLTLPTGLPSTGIQIMVPAGQENRLLRMGVAAQMALA